MTNTLSQLEELFSKINVEIGPEIIQTWTMQEKKLIEEKNCKSSSIQHCRHLYLSQYNQCSIYSISTLLYRLYFTICSR